MIGYWVVALAVANMKEAGVKLMLLPSQYCWGLAFSMLSQRNANHECLLKCAVHR